MPAFSYPDHVFPVVPSPPPGLPLSPAENIKRIEDKYQELLRLVDNENKNTLETSPEESDSDDTPSPNPSEDTDQPPTLSRRLSQTIESYNDQPESDPLINPNDIDFMFKWARQTVDFAEQQSGLPTDIVDTALDIIILVSKAQPELTRFKGAALYIVGLWSLFGLFQRKVDTKLAFDLFREAAQSGFARAFYRIGSEFEKVGDTANALYFFNQGVLKNDSACIYRMAMCLLKGQLGIKTNIDLGRQYLERASSLSDPDCPQSSYVLGLIQLGEIESVAPPNPNLPKNAGIKAMERAAWLCYAPALLRMGMAWQGGEKGYDSAIALRYFHIASRQQQYLRYKGDTSAGLSGSAEAEISKWMLCGSDDVFEPNEEYAFFFAKLASEFSNPIAEFAVGYFCEVGIHVETDIKLAMVWYEIAASNGSKDAEERLKQLKLDRRNTISRHEHQRTLTIKGRGSVKQYKRKTSDPNALSDAESVKEAKYPDSSDSSRNLDIANHIQNPPTHTRAMSESFGLTDLPPIGPVPSLRSSRARASLPGDTTRLHQDHVRSSHLMRNRGVSSTLEASSMFDRGFDNRIPSPVRNYDNSKLDVQGLTNSRPQSASPLSVAESSRPTSRSSSVSMSPQPDQVDTPSSVTLGPELVLHESPAVTKKPKNKKKRFSITGLFSNKEKKESPEELKDIGDSSTISSSSSLTTVTEPAVLQTSLQSMIIDESTKLNSNHERSASGGSPQLVWNENTNQSNATMQGFPSSTTPANDNSYILTQRGYDLDPPPFIGRAHQRSPSPKTPSRIASPQGSPLSSPSKPPLQYSPSQTFTIESSSTSSSGLSVPGREATPASSVSSVRSGSASPVPRPKSNVMVIQAVPGGKGAKTFEEMGIPIATKQREDCIIM